MCPADRSGDRLAEARRRSRRATRATIVLGLPVLIASLALLTEPVMRLLGVDRIDGSGRWDAARSVGLVLLSYAIVSVPYIAALVTLDRLLGATARHRACKVLKTGRCSGCGYPLQASDGSWSFCTECGGRFGEDGMRLSDGPARARTRRRPRESARRQ